MKLLNTPRIYFKGIELAQSSQIKITKELLSLIINKILIENAGVKELHKIVNSYRIKILKRQISDIDDIVIVKKVGRMPESYKTLPAHVALAVKRKEQGEYFYTSMRIGFIVIKDKPLTIVHKDDFTGLYDEKYYWCNQIFGPTLRLLKTVYPFENWEKYNTGNLELQQDLGAFT